MTRTLVEALRQLGADVTMVTPRVRTPVYALSRMLFNEMLRLRKFEGDATVGIDADGYAIAGRRNSLPHIACIKGVLATQFVLKRARHGPAWRCRGGSKQGMRGVPIW